MADDQGSWAPKTRDDWVGLFADGFTKSREKYEEDLAKNKGKGGNEGGADGGNSDGNGNGSPAKRTFADILLGVKPS